MIKKNIPGILCAALAILLLAACCFLIPSGKLLPEAEIKYNDAILDFSEEQEPEDDSGVINWGGLETVDNGLVLWTGLEETGSDEAVTEETEAPAIMVFSFRKYGFVIAVSAAAALILGCVLSLKPGSAALNSIGIYSLICVFGGLILSRILFVACSFTQGWCNSAFWREGGLFRIWEGGFAMTGVLAAMLIAGKIVPSCRRVTGLSAPLFIAGERLAEVFTGTPENFKSALGFGISLGEYDGNAVPWYALLNEEYGELRLNVRLIEMIIALLIVIAVWAVPFLLKKRKICRRGDYRLPLFLVLYGMTQIMMECLRDDGHLALNFFLKAQQITAMMFAMAGLFMLIRPLKKYLFFAAMCAEVVIPVIALEFMLDRTNTAHIWIYAGMVLFLGRFIWAAGYSIHRQYFCEPLSPAKA